MDIVPLLLPFQSQQFHFTLWLQLGPHSFSNQCILISRHSWDLWCWFTSLSPVLWHSQYSWRASMPSNPISNCDVSIQLCRILFRLSTCKLHIQHSCLAHPWWHDRRRQIWTSRKCIRNAIIMLKYRNSYVIAANSFGNSKFVIKFADKKNLKYKFRICQVYKSEAPVDNKDLVSCKFQICPENLWCQHIYCQSPNLEMNWWCSQIESHISTLRMHLCDLQIWRRLPCGIPWTMDDMQVKTALKGASTLAPPSSKHPKWAPFTISLLESLFSKLDPKYPLDAAVRSCLAVSFFTLALCGNSLSCLSMHLTHQYTSSVLMCVRSRTKMVC